MNKKSLLLSCLAVMCVFMISVPVGQVTAYSQKTSNPNKIYISISTPIPPIPTYVDDRWTNTGSSFHIKGLQIDGIPIWVPESKIAEVIPGFAFPNQQGGGGWAFATVNCNVNLNDGTARIKAYVTLDWSLNGVDCGFCGKMAVTGTYITDVSNLQCGIWQGKLTLNGYGLFDGAKLNLSIYVQDGYACIEGWLRLPSGLQTITA